MQAQLQTLLQSYQNVSNSQLHVTVRYSSLRCKRFCKVIKMLAIHNSKSHFKTSSNAANAFAKLSKCQQFTTRCTLKLNIQQLQTLLQSYQNVSNSQHKCLYPSQMTRCKRFCKVIKMLAIHNLFMLFIAFCIAANAFAKLSKCQQFTTLPQLYMHSEQLQTLLQSYQNVSNSQLYTLE